MFDSTYFDRKSDFFFFETKNFTFIKFIYFSFYSKAEEKKKLFFAFE